MEQLTLWQILAFCVVTGTLGMSLVLDGFDLGLAMLLPFIAKNNSEKKTILNSLAPIWDGNEVWLIMTGALLFALFPVAYASGLSNLYLPVIALSVVLILRAIAFEYWYHGKNLKFWESLLTSASFLVMIIGALAVGGFINGFPMDNNNNFVITLTNLLTPVSLLTVATSLVFVMTHGCSFGILKTTGDLQMRIVTIQRKLVVTGTILFLGLAALISIKGLNHNASLTGKLVILTALFLSGTLIFAKAGKHSFLMLFSALAIIAGWATLAAAQFPCLIQSTTGTNALTVANACASPHALKTMVTIALCALLPIAAWTIYAYRIFRTRQS